MINYCKTCQYEICNKPKNKFCSRSCAATFNNKNSPKRHRTPCHICPICGQETRFKSCSVECSKTYQFQTITKPRIECGEVSRPETLKAYITKLVGYKCSICDNSGWHLNSPLKLQLDHIDGNSDNNLPSNIRLLCPNCHSQTETFTTRQKKDTKRNRYLRKFKGY